MFGSNSVLFFKNVGACCLFCSLSFRFFIFLPCDDGDGIRWAVALLRRSCYWRLGADL